MISRPHIALFSLAAAALLACADTAGAQPKPAQPIRIRGCVQYLQLGIAQAAIINRDLDRAAELRAGGEARLQQERVLKLREEQLRAREEQLRMQEQARLAPGGATPLALPSFDSTFAPPSAGVAQAPYTDADIIRLEVGVESKQKILAAIDNAYTKCIAIPPQAKVETAPPEQKKAPAPRATRAAPQSAPAASARPAQGGHDPGASAVIGIVGGGVRF
jgi:hypothetical protein